MAADDEPDFAILLTGVARVVADRLGAAVREAGVPDMRTPYGFVIRALASGDRTLTEIADLLAVSKQSAIKVIDEMERRGFLERHPLPTDRRAKVLRLTPKGQQVRSTALAASHAMERDLARLIGADDVAATRRALIALLDHEGGLDAARSGSSRATW